MSTSPTNSMPSMNAFNISLIDASLTQIACRQVIAEAARILNAEFMSNDTADSYVVLGYDKELTRPDETTLATRPEIDSYRLVCCARYAKVDSDELTLMDVIKYLLACPDVYEEGNPFEPRSASSCDENDEDDEDGDSVTLDQIIDCIGLSSTTPTPTPPQQ